MIVAGIMSANAPSDAVPAMGTSSNSWPMAAAHALEHRADMRLSFVHLAAAFVTLPAAFIPF